MISKRLPINIINSKNTAISLTCPAGSHTIEVQIVDNLHEQQGEGRYCVTITVGTGARQDYYQIKEQVAVGGITNMYRIVEEMVAAALVVNL